MLKSMLIAILLSLFAHLMISAIFLPEARMEQFYVLGYLLHKKGKENSIIVSSNQKIEKE
jgi:hypothetical protein